MRYAATTVAERPGAPGVSLAVTPFTPLRVPHDQPLSLTHSRLTMNQHAAVTGLDSGVYPIYAGG
jgi:hypothetical protein